MCWFNDCHLVSCTSWPPLPYLQRRNPSLAVGLGSGQAAWNPKQPGRCPFPPPSEILNVRDELATCCPNAPATMLFTRNTCCGQEQVAQSHAVWLPSSRVT